jgi:Bacterial SH3 domain
MNLRLIPPVRLPWPTLIFSSASCLKSLSDIGLMSVIGLMVGSSIGNPSFSFAQEVNPSSSSSGSESITTINDRIKALAEQEKKLLSPSTSLTQEVPLKEAPQVPSRKATPELSPPRLGTISPLDDTLSAPAYNVPQSSKLPLPYETSGIPEKEVNATNPRLHREIQVHQELPESRSCEAQARQIKKLQAGLSDAKLRLAIAETQVERLSSLLQNSQKDQPLYKDPLPPKSSNVPSTVSETSDEVESSSREPFSSSGQKLREAPITPKLENRDAVPIATVTAIQVNLRAAPQRGSGIIATVPQGTRLIVEKQNGSWYRIISPTGLRAWVQSSVVSLSSPFRPAESIPLE